MKRVSCIDIGTNTALLLIADLDTQEGSIKPVFHKQTIIRLGKNVDEQKIIDHEAMQRLISCMTDYKHISKEHDVQQIIAAGTSALRDAKNRMEIIDEVVRACGIVIKTISGEEEAALTFSGAVAGMEELPETFSVIDIGGGSTEITMGNAQTITGSVSMNIGSVRLTERFFSSQPPTEEEFNAAKEEINRQLTEHLPPFFEAREHVYGVAGTLTTIAAVVSGLEQFDPEKIHNFRLTCEQVGNLLDLFRRQTLNEIMDSGIPEGRADVITMGALILHQFMKLLGTESIRVSIQGLRYGMAWKELQKLVSDGETTNSD
ncbi:MAG: Ppx/GppA family phosphatase [Prosthecochloris sp.]|uniref:Ppx/GppA phosphatase family protein n=1 Tax=Prosthecochloris sp. TaxID=290513 RepID=UPI0013C5C34C|nr:Ppx/GppA phosphatase family protein [Prosthecochloris sp.]NEX11279.1 Ppx/GppA family phosphatase [Prosthecochloris sp.]